MARTEERGWYVSDITWCGETDSTVTAESGAGGVDGAGGGGSSNSSM